jgi:uncharacterized membrane protein YsdA (DUF1294 family)
MLPITLILVSYFVLINLATFGAFALDKVAAENQRRRTPEMTLLGLAFIGGSLGALTAQQLLRHKTRKQPFRAILIAIAALHIIGAATYLGSLTNIGR